MRPILKTYNKDALLSNLRHAEVTNNIIRKQINSDNFAIRSSKHWGWYLVKTEFLNSACPSQGRFNIDEEIGRHTSELNLLKYYLINKM